jgi:hypothetical protein
VLQQLLFQEVSDCLEGDCLGVQNWDPLAILPFEDNGSFFATLVIRGMIAFQIAV